MSERYEVREQPDGRFGVAEVSTGRVFYVTENRAAAYAMRMDCAVAQCLDDMRAAKEGRECPSLS